MGALKGDGLKIGFPDLIAIWNRGKSQTRIHHAFARRSASIVTAMTKPPRIRMAKPSHSLRRRSGCNPSSLLNQSRASTALGMTQNSQTMTPPVTSRSSRTRCAVLPSRSRSTPTRSRKNSSP